jgi:glutathionylspermidine amidase/synthetase
MSRRHPAQPEPFGTLLGIASGGVEVYSSHYDSLKPGDMPDRSAFKSMFDGIYMGYKWQCVELARRWLYINKGYIFDDIAMAYDIFRLRTVKVIKDSSELPLYSFTNGAKRPPEVGSLMIWKEGGEYEMTGHVAVVTEVTSDCVCIVEQNVEHTRWPEGATCSRELPLRKDVEGSFWVRCTYENADILGWVIQTSNSQHAEIIENIDPQLFNLAAKEIKPKQGEWLDTKREAQAAFVASMGGCRLASNDQDLGKYFVMSETARKELKRATNELHAMFFRATEYVLNDETLLKKFNLPSILLPRIRKSWEDRRTHCVTGRFDFGMSEKGLKVYEYNADSASCYMESALVQGLWAQHHGVKEGRDSGARLFDALVAAWQKSHVKGVLHILQDDGAEEDYHARFMKTSIAAAGIPCKIIKGFKDLQWDDKGCVVDSEGERIDWVWKTWAWETALDQLRDESVDEELFLSQHKLSEKCDKPPKLIDILLRPDVMVFEPLWTLIPSNKAILPVLWMLFPDHPYLLEAHFELNERLKKEGYVTKPIVGRCGENISVVNADNNILEQTTGQFKEQDEIYQALFELPQVDGLYTQVCTFVVDGVDAGACIRCDRSLIIKSQSDLLALRIIPDSELLKIIS